jgi:hypothetical protein
LMKAVIRSGSGDANPADGDQVRTSFLSSLQSFIWCRMLWVVT